MTNEEHPPMTIEEMAHRILAIVREAEYGSEPASEPVKRFLYAEVAPLMDMMKVATEKAATNREMFRTMQARAEQAEMKLRSLPGVYSSSEQQLETPVELRAKVSRLETQNREYIAMIDDAAPAMRFALADATKSTITGLDYTWAEYWIARHGEIIAEFGLIERHL